MEIFRECSFTTDWAAVWPDGHICSPGFGGNGEDQYSTWYISLTRGQCYFIEGLGNQTLEYSLSSSALLLAQAKGLHHQSDITNVDDEGPNRNWLFWAIYCYATHLTFLSGRAPVCLP